MNLNNVNIDALIKKVQKEVQRNKKVVKSVEEVEDTSSEVFDEMKKLPFTE